MVRPTAEKIEDVTFEAYQGSQVEALEDTNAHVKRKAKRSGAAKEEEKKKPYDEKKAVRQKAHIRLHRDMARALHEYADKEKLTYSELVRQCVALGMKQLGISY